MYFKIVLWYNSITVIASLLCIFVTLFFCCIFYFWGLGSCRNWSFYSSCILCIRIALHPNWCIELFSTWYLKKNDRSDNNIIIIRKKIVLQIILSYLCDIFILVFCHSIAEHYFKLVNCMWRQECEMCI